MAQEGDLQRILETILIAVIRAPDGDRLVEVSEALIAGGVTNLEITLTVPRADEVIRQVVDAVGDRALVGAGTVLDLATAQRAVDAGARFLVTPVTDTQVIDFARSHDRLVVPGAFSPTEIHTAWQAGADIVKVFPADVAGPAYFKALRGPLPEVRLMPTGGVNLDTVAPFLKAGACALGVGGALVDAVTLALDDFAEQIEQRARKYAAAVAAVAAARVDC
ncbi:MAG: bifunctional 4-hydroxy-2-oxoglutarate aldolase/2-dehydro-3-deoxy-phosphogluconate aldolase [Planctomycetota bacterium]|nr:MAG: bifunctional 4-hydroxy-2-oxoglutarate aldolase/2-dehydro-3-deoxy-phosphogluconate aldolase [Planctomycetota bacterium]